MLECTFTRYPVKSKISESSEESFASCQMTYKTEEPMWTVCLEIMFFIIND